MSELIEITVNGEPERVPTGTTVAQLLQHMGLEAGQAAVERNRQVVRRADHPTELLAPDDTLEIVTFVGGG